MIQLTRALRNERPPARPDQKSRLISIAETATVVTAFANVAAFARAAAVASHWMLGSATRDIGLAEVVQGALLAGIVAVLFLSIVGAVVGLAFATGWLFDLVAKLSPRFTAWLARKRRSQDGPSSTAIAVAIEIGRAHV